MSTFPTKPDSVEPTKTSNFNFLNLLTKLIVLTKTRTKEKTKTDDEKLIVCGHVLLTLQPHCLHSLRSSHTPPGDHWCECNAIVLKYSCSIFARILRQMTAVVSVMQYFCNVLAILLNYCCNIFAISWNILQYLSIIFAIFFCSRTRPCERSRQYNAIFCEIFENIF